MLSKISLEALLEWFVGPALRIILILVGAWLLSRVTRPILERLEPLILRARQRGEPEAEAQKRAHTLTHIMWHVVRITIAVVAVIMVLGQLGLQIGPILAGVGIVGLAVGFGAQSLVKDVISGFFLLLENHYRVGDWVEVGSVEGLVEAATLRVTVLRDRQGRIHVIPNGEITILTNYTMEWSRALLDIGVAYKEDVDEVMAVLTEVGEQLREDEPFSDFILEPMEIMGVEEFGDSQVTIRLFFKPQPLKQWMVAREFRRPVKKTFDERGIEIPFPHRTVYMGSSDHQGRLVVEHLPASNGDGP